MSQSKEGRLEASGVANAEAGTAAGAAGAAAAAAAGYHTWTAASRTAGTITGWQLKSLSTPTVTPTATSIVRGESQIGIERVLVCAERMHVRARQEAAVREESRRQAEAESWIPVRYGPVEVWDKKVKWERDTEKVRERGVEKASRQAQQVEGRRGVWGTVAEAYCPSWAPDCWRGERRVEGVGEGGSGEKDGATDEVVSRGLRAVKVAGRGGGGAGGHSSRDEKGEQEGSGKQRSSGQGDGASRSRGKQHHCQDRNAGARQARGSKR